MFVMGFCIPLLGLINMCSHCGHPHPPARYWAKGSAIQFAMHLIVIVVIIALAAGATHAAVPKTQCADKIAGGSWRLVRHVPAGAAWHPAKDQLRGTAVYGDASGGETSTEPFSVKFDDSDFDQFLFATGDCEKWLVADRGEVLSWYNASEPRTILQSSTSGGASYSARWYRRESALEDPWISLTDHSEAIAQGNILYGENGFGSTHATAVLPRHMGANVFVRKAKYHSAVDFSNECANPRNTKIMCEAYTGSDGPLCVWTTDPSLPPLSDGTGLGTCSAACMPGYSAGDDGKCALKTGCVCKYTLDEAKAKGWTSLTGSDKCLAWTLYNNGLRNSNGLNAGQPCTGKDKSPCSFTENCEWFGDGTTTSGANCVTTTNGGIRTTNCGTSITKQVGSSPGEGENLRDTCVR